MAGKVAICMGRGCKRLLVRQLKELEPNVTPVSINVIAQDQYEVKVQQLIKDLDGNVIADGLVKHFYFFENGLIAKMEIVAL